MQRLCLETPGPGYWGGKERLFESIRDELVEQRPAKKETTMAVFPCPRGVEERKRVEASSGCGQGPGERPSPPCGMGPG